MEPRRPEDGVTSLVGLPSRDMIYAAGFGLGRSDGMVGTPRRRGDGVWAAGVLPSRQPAGAPLEVRACELCRRSPISGYVGPTTLFVASVVDFVQLKFKLHPHSKISSEMN